MGRFTERLYLVLLISSVAYLLLVPFTYSLVSNTSSVRDQIVGSLFADYQSHVRPGELRNDQTVVVVYISVSAITSVDVRTMEYTIDMLLRQEWQDLRLAWDHLPKFANFTKNIVSPVFKEMIWLPDLFFRNGKQGRLHKMTCENLLIRIKPNGEVLYSQKITMRLACQMDLRTFPMDTQKCNMNIGSYGYTLEQLRFVWRNDSPVSLPEDLQISEFDPPKSVLPYDCTAGYSTTTGHYTCLSADFTLSRQLGYWLASTYVPNILILVVSWLNFWVSLDAVPARVNLSLLTLLGLITQSTSYASSLPRVSYIKAIDVWTIACITFNSGVLLEFAVASHVSRRRKVSQWQSDVRKLVRRELAKWCSACQQEYHQRGPSATLAYLGVAMNGADKALNYFNSAAAAFTTASAPTSSSADSSMSVHLTKSGMAAALSEDAGRYVVSSTAEGCAPALAAKKAGYTCKSGKGGNEGGGEWWSAASGAIGFDPALEPPPSYAYLSSIETAPDNVGTGGKKKEPRPQQVSRIDYYSRFLFPSCFLLYNCCYWMYYLVIVDR